MSVHLIQNSFHANVVTGRDRLDYEEGFWNKYADEIESEQMRFTLLRKLI
jgi:hypothetical protein